MSCGRISDDILNDCALPIVGGTKARLILINAEDLNEASYTYDMTNEEIIKTITMSSSPAVRAYEFEGIKNSNEASISLVPTPYSAYVNHQILFRIFKNVPEAKSQINQMIKGRFIAIVENNYTGVDGNGSFELYGKIQGLEISELTRSSADSDTQGAYVITLSSPADQKEPSLPASIFDTSYAVTKAMVDSLLA